MSETQAWTIGRLLQWTADYLKQHGSESPRLEAEVLLAFARGCKRIELYTSFEETASDELRTRFRALVKRRADGVPFAYLVGSREFYSLQFEVTPDVLIPRPETELLVITLLDLLKERSKGQPGAPPAKVADIGTGSGIIAVCVAKLGKCQVTAVDISRAALEVAKRNAAKNGVSEQIEFVESDLFAKLPAGEPFDFIVSNPPYISASEMLSLPRDVRDHEPHLALAAGPAGTDVIERLVPEAAARLAPGGALAFEISPMIETAVWQIVSQCSSLKLQPTLKDLAGLARVILARQST